MRLLTRLCCVLFVALLPLLYTSLTPTASASNFTVNSLADTSDANTSDGLCADSNGVCTLRAAIQQMHSYEVPEVIALPVVDGSAEYLEWLDGNIRNPTEKPLSEKEKLG